MPLSRNAVFRLPAHSSVLASMLPGFAPAPTAAAAAGIERSLGRLGITASLAAPSVVAAAAAPLPAPYYSPVGPAAMDGTGQMINPIPAPVLLHKGKPRSEWTADEQYADFAHKLGPAISRGVPRPPRPDHVFQPSPNAPSVPIVGPDGVVTGWQANPNYRGEA
jgi:hypothetical protein